MFNKRSAGILLFRGRDASPEVLLGHMGGPFWDGKDVQSWSIPKGEYGPEEPAIDAAYREFQEELGVPVPAGERLELGEARQYSGKIVTAWAVRADLDPSRVVPGTFKMEWPRGSGRLEEFPEIDRAAWFDLETAFDKLVAGQRVFLDRLTQRLDA
jgi:predicted NUDIX family NTP pyrophosphohydrolase